MSLVVPFRALRPSKSVADRVAAPPYDVLNVEEARQWVKGNPLSFLHVEKSEIDVPDASGVDDRRIYEMARTNLEAMARGRILVRDEAPQFYLYRQRMGDRIQSGIVAGVSIAEYESGKIKRHELTRADKERERITHIDTVGAQTGPVFMAYRGREAINRLADRIAAGPPEVDLRAADGVGHTVWRIAGADDVREVAEGFASVEALYIADGHHRAAAAAAVCRLRESRGPASDGAHRIMMAVLFPQDQLRIMDYNRAVRDLNGLTPEAFLQRVGERFQISEGFAGRSPEKVHDFGMYLAGAWRRLTAREEILQDLDPVAALDVSILQDHLLGPVLGIGDPRRDPRIEFVGGIRGMEGLERLVDGGGFAAAFSLYPPALDQMMAVADSGQVMPPKSTWFEPKLLSGLFVHLLG